MTMDTTVQFSYALVASNLIQWLKSQKWFPFAQLNAFWLNTGTAIVASLVSSGALLYTFSNGVFTLHADLNTILPILKTAAEQYVMQHFVYKAAIAPPPTPLLPANAATTAPAPVTRVETKKLSVSQVDAILDSAGVTNPQLATAAQMRISIKNSLLNAGFLDDGSNRKN